MIAQTASHSRCANKHTLPAAVPGLPVSFAVAHAADAVGAVAAPRHPTLEISILPPKFPVPQKKERKRGRAGHGQNQIVASWISPPV